MAARGGVFRGGFHHGPGAPGTPHAGAGIGGCQVKLAQQDTRLRRVLPEAFALKLDTWVTMHEDLRNSPRCRATFDALVAGLQRYIQD